MMLALLKKDWRILRTGTIGAAVVIVSIYAIAVISLLATNGTIRRADAENTLASAGLIGLWISAVISAMYGSGAFALERQDRSAEFLAMMPVSRWRIMTSKIIVMGGCALVFYLIDLGIWAFLECMPSAPKLAIDSYVEFVVSLFGMNLFFFGVAWLASSFLKSSAISFGATIAFCAIALTVLVNWISHHNDHAMDRSYEIIAGLWIYTIGVVGFVAGAIYYPSRIAP